MFREPDLSVPDRIRAAHGCSLVGWGSAAVFLLLTGALRIPALDRTPIPSYGVALVAVFAGLWKWKQACGVGPENPVTRRSLAPAALLLYLAPFYSGWLRVPHASFFLVHVFAIAAAGLWLLFEINRAGARLARRLGCRELGAEMDAIGCCVLAVGMAVPVFSIYSIFAAWIGQQSLYAVSFALLYPRSRIWLVPVLIPFSLTLTGCWRLYRAVLTA